MTLNSIITQGSGASQLEKDNALMKIREVLVDIGSSGVSVTLPVHINLYPYQGLYFFWLGIAAVFFCIGGIILWINY